MTSLPLASVAETFGSTVLSGPLLLGLLVAMLAGFISFASPCIIPLVPGYLSFLAGLVGAEAPAVSPDESPKKGRLRVLGAALLFVSGYTLVYVIFAVSVFQFLNIQNDEKSMLLFQRLGGVVVITMGLIFLGTIQTKDMRLNLPVRLTSWVGAPVLGAVFAIGWIPCNSATLSAVLTTAGSTEGTDVLRGTLLVVAYCFGLGLPFLILAVSSAWAVRSLGFLRRNARTIQILGGIMMLVVGALLLFGWWNGLVGWIREIFIVDAVLPI